VVAATDRCLGPGWDPQPDDVTVLFAGSVRPEKGLPELVEAITRVEGLDRLLVPGRLGPAARGWLEVSDPRVVLEDRFLDAEEYRDRFARSVLSVLPYRRTYVDHGIFSSVLAESMAYGRPMVVSEHLAGLLPPDYRGAVVAGPGPDGIARAISEALRRLPELTREAMTTGRAFAAERFTYERYLSTILGLVR
jgi:glycosyltransferase involved in cell wall biosynthesis